MPAARPARKRGHGWQSGQPARPLWQWLVAVMLQVLALALPGQALAREPNITASLVAEGPGAPGQTITLAFVMQPKPGWHGYWQNPGDAGLGMGLEWTLPAGAKAGALQYPVPETLLISGLMNHVYEHDYAVLVPLTLPANAAPGQRLDVAVDATWLACTDEVCVPEQGRLSTTVTVGTGIVGTGRDARFDAWRAALPAPLGSPASFAWDGAKVRIGIPLPAAVQLDSPHLFLGDDRVVDYAAPQKFFRQGDLLVVELDRAKIAPAQPGALNAVLRLNGAGDGVTLTAAPGAVKPGGEPVGEARSSAPLAMLVLAALAGGLLLNVMPCVFPILSLKALSLARAGESEGQARAEGLAYTAGVVLACLALGALMLGLRAAGQEVGWAFQLQEPLVVAALLLVAVAITANLTGLYEFAVPGFASAGSPQGAFATGLLAAFAATPCTGPFMAAAMGAALLLPTLPALLLFGALGLGLALPFLAIAFVPALRRMLPRPGAWMVWFRRAMAVPMGLTALALVWLASRVAGSAFALSAALLGFLLVCALLLLGRRHRHRGHRRAGPANRGARAQRRRHRHPPRPAVQRGRAGQGARQRQAGVRVVHCRLVPDLQGQRTGRDRARGHPRRVRTRGRGGAARRLDPARSRDHPLSGGARRGGRAALCLVSRWRGRAAAIAASADPRDAGRTGEVGFAAYSTCPSSTVIVAPVTQAEASPLRNSSGASSASIGHIRRRWKLAIWRWPPSVWNQSPAISVWI